jgi:hypothetical protein
VNPSFPATLAKYVPTSQKLDLFAVTAVDWDPVAIYPPQSTSEKGAMPISRFVFHLQILTEVK